MEMKGWSLLLLKVEQRGWSRKREGEWEWDAATAVQ
jgi:hypothetical protein